MNKKRFSVVIPHYDESAEEVATAVASVRSQMGFDLSQVEVLICTDGEGLHIGKELSEMPWIKDIDIREVVSETNGGPGMMRQLGIDVALGEWIVFIDADDILHNAGVLFSFDETIKKNAPDIVTSRWLEEQQRRDGSIFYLEHAHDNTWMHGKAFRTEWLRATGEKHDPTLRVHEDSYILKVWETCAPRYARIDGTTYVWRWRADSTVRKNEGIYAYDSLPEWVRAIALASENIRKKGKKENILQPLLYLYFKMQGADWRTDAHRGHLQALRRAIIDYWGKWFTDVPPYDSEAFKTAYNDERRRTFGNGLEVEPWIVWFSELQEEHI